MQQQNTIISESSKLSFYRKFYEFGKRALYVDELTNRNDRSHLAKLRLSAHSLEIERGRYSKKAKTDRICTLCKDNKIVLIEDENHFLSIALSYLQT
jgi:hypothetical protein